MGHIQPASDRLTMQRTPAPSTADTGLRYGHRRRQQQLCTVADWCQECTNDTTLCGPSAATNLSATNLVKQSVRLSCLRLLPSSPDHVKAQMPVMADTGAGSWRPQPSSNWSCRLIQPQKTYIKRRCVEQGTLIGSSFRSTVVHSPPKSLGL